MGIGLLSFNCVSRWNTSYRNSLLQHQNPPGKAHPAEEGEAALVLCWWKIPGKFHLCGYFECHRCQVRSNLGSLSCQRARSGVGAKFLELNEVGWRLFHISNDPAQENHRKLLWKPAIPGENSAAVWQSKRVCVHSRYFVNLVVDQSLLGDSVTTRLANG